MMMRHYMKKEKTIRDKLSSRQIYVPDDVTKLYEIAAKIYINTKKMSQIMVPKSSKVWCFARGERPPKANIGDG